jgi:hypothetical protein
LSDAPLSIALSISAAHAGRGEAISHSTRAQLSMRTTPVISPASSSSLAGPASPESRVTSAARTAEGASR